MAGPAGSEGEDRPRALVFGEVAEQYDRSRPTYPEAVLDAIAAEVPAGGSVVDVGCGTGIATRQLAQRGFRVIGIEPSPAMAEVARRQLGSDGPTAIVTARFEDWEGPDQPVDAVTAAQSWHWVDPDAGLAQAARILAPGGLLATFWNAPRPDAIELLDELQGAYRRVAPGLARDTVVLHWPYPDDLVDQHLAATDTFGEPRVHTWDWVATYTAQQYTDLLRTHSDHRLLPPEQLEALLVEVDAVIGAHGGSFDYAYRTVLVAATRR